MESHLKRIRTGTANIVRDINALSPRFNNLSRKLRILNTKTMDEHKLVLPIMKAREFQAINFMLGQDRDRTVIVFNRLWQGQGTGQEANETT